MKISFILTSADRVQDLRRFLNGLLRQTSMTVQMELIFVNQGIYDPRTEFSFDERVDYLEIKVGRLSLSKARNLGLQSASGEVLAFPDDDCWYAPDLLERIEEWFLSNLHVDCLCTSVYDPVRGLPYGGRPLDVSCRIQFSNLFKFPTSVGLFVRRSALEAAGAYFDESLGAGTGYGSGEEMEFISRLIKVGAHVEYVGAFQVFHPVVDYSEPDVAKYFKYGLGFGYLNGRLLRQGHLGVAGHFLNVLARSLGGAVVNAGVPLRRRLYWNRFNGIARGFIQGVGA